MRSFGVFLLVLVACGQDVTATIPDCGVPASHGDAGTAPDAAAPVADAGQADTGIGLDAAAPDAAGPLACHVDPFAACADPLETRANNTPSDAINRSLTGGNGCRSSDEFTPGSGMVSGRMCPTEPGDWFEFTYVPCDTITLIAELRVRVTTPCEREAWALELPFRPCDGTDPNVSCTWDGEWRVIRVLLPPSGSVGVFKFGVTHPGNDTAFDWEAQFELRR